MAKEDVTNLRRKLDQRTHTLDLLSERLGEALAEIVALQTRIAQLEEENRMLRGEPLRRKPRRRYKVVLP